MVHENNQLVQIGNICIKWSNLEYELAVSIWLMTEVTPEVGKILTGNLDAKQRATMAHALAHQTNAPIPFKKVLKEVLDEMRAGLIHRRNEAVHAVHFLPYAPDIAKVEMHRGKGGRHARELRHSDLAQLGKALNIAGLKIATANLGFAEKLSANYADILWETETALTILQKIAATKSAGAKSGPV